MIFCFVMIKLIINKSFQINYNLNFIDFNSFMCLPNIQIELKNLLTNIFKFNTMEF